MEREAKQVRVFDDLKGEEFVVDDLFDFSNGEFEDGFLEKNMEDDEREAKPYSVSIGNGEKTEEGNFGSVLTTNLCFPVDDVADEWLSHFVEDSFSGYSVPFPPKPTEKMKTKVIEKPFLKNPDQTKVKMHGKKSSIDSYGYGCGVHETHWCTHCGVQKTPQWRAGPMGPKSLCNACGVRYKSGRLLPEYRPACSPTFSSEVHSNSHRKVLEMRRKKEGF